jgi:hypothetical protein
MLDLVKGLAGLRERIACPVQGQQADVGCRCRHFAWLRESGSARVLAAVNFEDQPARLDLRDGGAWPDGTLLTVVQPEALLAGGHRSQDGRPRR